MDPSSPITSDIPPPVSACAIVDRLLSQPPANRVADRSRLTRAFIACERGLFHLAGELYVDEKTYYASMRQKAIKQETPPAEAAKPSFWKKWMNNV